MKARKNLYLSVEAVARGERLARRSQTSLSDLVEQQLLQISATLPVHQIVSLTML